MEEVENTMEEERMEEEEGEEMEEEELEGATFPPTPDYQPDPALAWRPEPREEEGNQLRRRRDLQEETEWALKGDSKFVFGARETRVEMEKERVRLKGEEYRDRLREEAMTLGNPTRQHVLKVALVSMWEVAKHLNNQEVCDEDYGREQRLSWLESRREERARVWKEEKEEGWLDLRAREKELDRMEKEMMEMVEELERKEEQEVREEREIELDIMAREVEMMVEEWVRREEQGAREELAEEVALGTFTPDQVWEVDKIVDKNGNHLDYVFLEVEKEREADNPTPDYDNDEDEGLNLLAIYRFMAFSRQHDQLMEARLGVEEWTKLHKYAREAREDWVGKLTWEEEPNSREWRSIRRRLAGRRGEREDLESEVDLDDLNGRQ